MRLRLREEISIGMPKVVNTRLNRVRLFNERKRERELVGTKETTGLYRQNQKRV